MVVYRNGSIDLMIRHLPHRSALAFAAALILIAAFGAFGQETQPWSQNTSPLPPPTGFVNDYANVIDPATKDRLETRLKQFRDGTNPSVEIAVVVVKTTGDRAIFDYSLAVARGWGIGSKQDDNPSALLLVAIDDRKYFTQISRDLEDELPDGLAGSLQRQYLVPEFRKGNYSKGIEDTINAYITAIENKGNVPAAPASTPSGGTGSTAVGGGLFGFFCCAIIIIVVLVMLFGGRGRRGPSSSDRGRWGGGGFGGGRGTDAGDIAAAALPWVIGSILSGSSSGSSSSSDWGSSGGSDWGGFGGGGDFGGGGAGGDW